MCLVVTPEIRKLTDSITQAYPEASKRAGLNADMVAEWVGAYNGAFKQPMDNVPTSAALVDYIEKQRNMDGKSFKYEPESITYTPVGKSKQTYTVLGTHIYNKNGKEVFDNDSKDRRKIFANLAVQQGRAVVVEHKGKKYVVNNRGQIISVTTGDEMRWGEENGDRKAILASAEESFEKRNTAPASLKGATEEVKESGGARLNQQTPFTSNESTEEIVLSSNLTAAIESGSWDKESLEEFDNLIKDIENDKVHSQRLPRRLRRKSNQGGRANVAAWLLTRRDAGTMEEKSRSIPAGERYERDKKHQVAQEKKIIAWAKAAGLWADNASNTVKGMKHLEEADGGEAKIYVKNPHTYRKLISTEYFITPQFMADRIGLHNLFSPSAPLTVVGFTQDEKGNLLFVVDQPFIEGTKPTREEIKDFAEKLGFEKKDKDKGNTYISKDGIYLSDLHDENVIKTPNGDLVIIDADFRLNTPDLNQEGNYVIDDSLVQVNPALEQFKEEVDELIVYYESGGDIGSDYPGLSAELYYKLADYFFGGEELSIEDYRELYKVMHPTINQEEKRSNINKEINYGQEFRRVQEAVRKGSGSTHKGFTGSQEDISRDSRQRLAEVLKRELGSQSSFSNGTIQSLTTTNKRGETNTFNLHTNVDPQLFHDVFEVARYYTSNGGLVDLHEDYTDCKCFLNEDGTCGFAIEADGNLVSVFNLGVKGGFLNAIADFAIQQGATHLDAYNSDVQPLRLIYEKVFGAKTASSMDYNMEYDHDDIAKNHGEPEVVFMVMGKSAEKEIEEKHFDKDQYDEAVGWQKANIDVEVPENLAKGATPIFSSPSNAASNNLAANAITFGAASTAEQQEVARQRVAEQTALKPEKPKPERPKSAAYESALKTNDSKVARFKRTFSPQQIKDRGAWISDVFSRILEEALFDEMDAQLDVIESDTTTKEEKQQAKQRLNALRDPVKGRQLEAQELGIPVLMNKVVKYITFCMEYAREEQKPLFQNTLDFFEELFNTQASLDIEEREGIRIVNLKVKEQTTAEEEGEENDNGNDEVGHIVSGSDGWSFQVRYENPFNSLSKSVRRMLYEVVKPDSERDDLGVARNYPMGQIYASLLSFLSKNMYSADDFISIDKSYTGEDSWGNDITETSYPNGYPTFPVLEKMKKTYPWVSQIIQRLTDDYLNPEWNSNTRFPSTGGAMASQFYTNFRKAFIPYGKIQKGNGKDGIIPLNYEMEDRVQYDKLVANYNNRMVLTDHSIYDADGKINRKNAKWLSQRLQHAYNEAKRSLFRDVPTLMEYHLQHPEDEVLTQKDIDEYNAFVDHARMLLQSFGIDATQDSVVTYLLRDNGATLAGMFADLHWIADFISEVEDSRVDSFNYIIDTRDKYKRNQWTHFFDNRGLITDASYIQSFYDSASHKTKYSYSADNYLMTVFRGVAMGTQEERRAFIDEHFGKFEWFRNQKTGEWRNKWLEYWYNDIGTQAKLPYRNIDNVTDYNGYTTRIRPYSKWEPDDIWEIQNRSYAPDRYRDNTAYYLSPIFSDSPMSMTVLGPKMEMPTLLSGYIDSDGVYRQGALVELVNQELWRIGYVQKRAEAIKNGTVKPIANFDGKRGKMFCFLPELNSYVFEDTGETFLQRMVRLREQQASRSEIEESQIQAIKDIVGHKMEEYVSENSNHYTGEEHLSERQYYNMLYANAAIIQLTTVDPAFYKNSTEFQKRFKETYAGGIQMNTNSKYGKKTENVVLLSDVIITSPNYKDIARVIDGAKNLTEEDKKAIKSVFKDINVADAQAIRSMHSYRSVLDMMGNWTDTMEEALNHFKNGEWNREDFDVIYQTIKPFAYSVIERNDGFGGTILVPQQHKNSEICALMMYDLIANGLNNSPFYKAVSRFMEDNRDAEGNHLVDMIQFESAGKVGNQGVVNVSFNPNKVMDAIENGITVGGHEYEFITAMQDGKYVPNDLKNSEANYKAIKDHLDEELETGTVSQDDYNNIMQQLLPTEDEIVSMLEQAVLVQNPDGTKSINTEVVHTMPFDNYYQQQPTPQHHIDAEATFGSQARNVNIADLPNDFEITLKGKKGDKVFKGKDTVVDFYYELLNENLIEDFFGKGKKKGLKGLFESKESLRDAVEEIVRGNPKYGRDFAEALQLDESGNFVLSPNSPTMFNLMQEIITSFFKNRITKQTINGAALIQAAGIGLDKDLRIVFDEEGKLLGAECYMPLTTKKFFEPLLETRTINGKKEKVLSPKKLKAAGLDKAVGYRIPTENKSSMMPLVIKGFTPLQNGSTIVLPAEVTAMAGSDFDVDKMFVMLNSFIIQNYAMRAAREAYAKENDVFNEMLSRYTNSELAEDILDSEPQSFKDWFKEHEKEYRLKEPRIRKVEYDFSKSPKENDRKARNNMLIQMMYSILTSKEGSESLFNPQGFEDVKKAAKVMSVLNNQNLWEQFLEDKQDTETALKALLGSSVKELENFIDAHSQEESPAYPQTFAHSHAKNMAGMNQIGIYALQGSMAAKYQRADVRLRPEQRFILNGREISNVDVSDGGKRLKNVVQMVGASADNGKTPSLSDMGSTSRTAPMIGYMLRAGLSHIEAALIVGQPHMKNGKYSPDTAYWYEVLGKVPLASTPINVTTEMLVKSIVSPSELTAEENKAIAGVCYRILQQCKAMEYLSQVSRADSPNGALQNTYAKARVQRYKVDLLQAKMGQKSFPFVRIKEALSNEAVDTKASEGEVREQLRGQKMGFLHGMYALGIGSFQHLVSPYFFGADEHFDSAIVQPILYNLNERMPDEKKASIVDSIYKDYITYRLSVCSLFGSETQIDGSVSTMKAKRAYYLETFPNDYIKIIQENKDIRDLLGSILQVQDFDSRRKVVLQSVGSLSNGLKQDIQRRFDSLAYSDNPVARNLAKDLFVYSYFDNGLQFTHDSFSHLFTTEFLTSFPAYTETLNSLNTAISPEEEENFIAQFLLTHPEATYKADGIISDDNFVGGSRDTLRIDLNDKKVRKKMINEVMSPNPLSEGINVYPYIYFDDGIYILDKELFEQYPGAPVYNRVKKYSTYPKLPLFSMQMSIMELAQEFPSETTSKFETPNSEDADTPVSHDEFDEDPAVSNDMYAAFDAMDDFDVPDFFDAPLDETATDADKYQNEGEAELRDPFCGL